MILTLLIPTIISVKADALTAPTPLPGNLVPTTPSTNILPILPNLGTVNISSLPVSLYNIKLTSSGLMMSDSLTNETETQQQLQSTPGYWRYGGDAPLENAPYAISRDTQGLHIGVQAPSNGTWAGYYAVTRGMNAMVFNSLITTPDSSIPSNFNWYENGMYVQNATGDVNYVTCTSNTSILGTQWVVSAANGNPFGATTFTPLWWSAMTPTQPLTHDCTIITNGNNFLQVDLDGTPVYNSNSLKLNMSSNLIAFMEPQTNYAGQLLSGTFKNFYATSSQNVEVTNNPLLASRVDVVEPTSSTTGTVIATAPVDSSGNASLDIGNYAMPVNAYIIVYDSNGDVLASTSNPVNIFGGDVYSVNLITSSLLP